MNRKNSVGFILSHSRNSGYDFGNSLDEIISDKHLQEWIKSYISVLTEYASDSKYVSKEIATRSYFTKDDYAVILNSYTNKDNRFFLESKVAVTDLRCTDVNFCNFVTESNIFSKISDIESLEKILIAILISFVGENTTLYCLADNEKIVNLFFSLVYSLDQRLLYKNACVEVMGNIPSIYSSIVLCRCVESRDRESFLDKINRNNNSILVDLTNSEPKITYKIAHPTFAQLCVKHLSAKYNGESIYFSLVESLDCATKFVLKNKRSFFNIVSFFCVRTNYPDDMKQLSMTSEEKYEIESLLK